LEVLLYNYALLREDTNLYWFIDFFKFSKQQPSSYSALQWSMRWACHLQMRVQ